MQKKRKRSAKEALKENMRNIAKEQRNTKGIEKEHIKGSITTIDGLTEVWVVHYFKNLRHL